MAEYGESEGRRNMLDNDHQPAALLEKHRITRRAMLLTTGGALVGILLGGCAGDQAAQPSGPVSGAFIGRDENSANFSERAGDRFGPAPLFAILAEKAED